MPRGRLTNPKSPGDREAIRTFVDNHIVQARIGKRGEILGVKHVQFGWIEPETYYQLQQFHAYMPLIIKFVEGGYRLKASIWSASIQAGPVSLPVGGFVPAYALSRVALAISEGNQQRALEFLLALALPFGDIWLIWMMLAEAVQATELWAESGLFGLVGLWFSLQNPSDEARESLKKFLGLIPLSPII